MLRDGEVDFKVLDLCVGLEDALVVVLGFCLESSHDVLEVSYLLGGLVGVLFHFIDDV